MNKRNMGIIIGAVVVVAGVVIGLVVANHNTNTPTNTTSSTTNSNQPTAVNNSVVATKTKSGIGQYLTDTKDNTLYFYENDSKGVSNCSGSCLASWPPYVDTGATTNLPTNVGTLKRSDDDKTQYTYNGLPLYYFSGDSAGQVTGNGVSDFEVAKP